MEDKIKNIIKKEFDANTLEIQKLAEGFSHDKFLIKFDKPPFEAIVRFENASIKDKEKGLVVEKWVIEKLRERNIPAPEIYRFNNSQEEQKDNYMIIEKLQGTRLDSIWDNLTQGEKIQITEEIGKLLSQIHSIKLDSFGKIKAGGQVYSDLTRYMFKNANETSQEFNWFARELFQFSASDIGRLISYKNIKKELPGKLIDFISQNLEIWKYEGKPTLIHGDFHKDHFFIKKQNNIWKITGLIDFEFAASLCPEYDMLKLDRQGFFDDPELMNAFEKGYGKFNLNAVKIYRIIRDIGFGCVLIDCGNTKKGIELLNSAESQINSFDQTKSQKS